MIYKVEITDEAKADLKEGIIWYKNKNSNLVEDFVSKVEKAVKTISENPLQFVALYKNSRKFKIDRFPYNIIYIIKEEKVIIFSIMHTSRNPQNWQKRV
ncbi:MAG: type II toxin-antitoxin system RelE/ParE family toxin [Bacteroidales bacterium]|nr:type II toxin-antitoxin system RelE/ParE family toxin [Bacteroidales bacterium]